RSVRLVILVGLAIDQIAQSGLSSLSVIYYSAQLFSQIFLSSAVSSRFSFRNAGLFRRCSTVSLMCFFLLMLS
ncbi:hypothetical protein, partial [Serratia nevei]|uniref:hypothetical protein n=1 Tax=Serratia nevei TaxID=2703794 RepID=UPI00254B6DDB